MSTNILQFKADLRKAAEQIDADVAQLTRRVGLGVYKRLIEKTPVDTGRARASWTIAYDAPDLTVQPEGQYPEPPTPNLPLTTTPHPIWISNALDYIEALNNGHSQQSPAGFVELSILEEEAELLGLL